MGSRTGSPERTQFRRPTRQRFLRAVWRHRASRFRRPSAGRANSRRPQAARAADARRSAPIRPPAASNWCRASPQNSALRVTVGAWIDKHQERNEREIRSVIDLAKRHSNVNGIIVGNETIYRGDHEGQRTDPDDPARQAFDQGAGHHRRNLERVDRASRTGLASRLHRRAHPALLGRLLRQAGGRSGDPDLRQAARRPIPASAS